MPKVDDAHLEARREQIIHAARTCFARKGFHRTTLQDICQEADLSAGAVYRYFASKEEIILASCVRHREHVQSLFDASQGTSESVSVVRQMVDLFAGDLQRPGAEEAARAAVNTWGEAAVNPEVRSEQRAALDNAIAFLTGFTRSAQIAGELNPDIAPEAFGRLMTALYDGIVLQQAIDPDTDVGAYAHAVRAVLEGRLWRQEVLARYPDDPIPPAGGPAA
jgi:AcrR family transcriptional regulator